MASTGRGQAKPASTASNGNKSNGNHKHKKKSPQVSDTNSIKSDDPKLLCNILQNSIQESDISIDIPSESDITQNLKSYVKEQINILKADYEQKLNILKVENDAKVETLHRILATKEEVIGKLQKEIGELQKSYSFLSNENSEIKNKVTANETSINNKIDQIEQKSTDLEDRSRRNNLVFFGIEEHGDKYNTENCEALVTNILINTGVIGKDDIHDQMYDRAHRLGPKKPGQERPRPIIVRMTFYKDKQYILSQTHKLKRSTFGISEDFSKYTLSVRKTLLASAKIAKSQCKEIKSFKLNYKRLVLQYERNDNGRMYTYYKSFAVTDVNQSNWFLPKPRNQGQSGRINNSNRPSSYSQAAGLNRDSNSQDTAHDGPGAFVDPNAAGDVPLENMTDY